MSFKKKKNDKTLEREKSALTADLPVYRYYGQTSKHPLRDKVMAAVYVLIGVIAVGVILGYVILALTGMYMFSKSKTLYAVTAVALLVIFFLYFTRKLRPLYLLCSKLKKIGKGRYEPEINGGTMSAIKNSPEKTAITFEDNERVYYIHILYIERKRDTICFDSENSLRIVRPPINQVWIKILNDQTKEKQLSLDFSDARQFSDKQTVKAIVVCQKGENMRVRLKSGGETYTGNGGEHFGYTVFTLKGFINYVRRIQDIS